VRLEGAYYDVVWASDQDVDIESDKEERNVDGGGLYDGEDVVDGKIYQSFT
jgi:hypothetical protein